MAKDISSKEIFDSIDQPSGFNLDEKMPTIIKVVGVGGGGNNAINHMYEQNISGVSFVVINTDRQALSSSPVPNRLLIGMFLSPRRQNARRKSVRATPAPGWRFARAPRLPAPIQ